MAKKEKSFYQRLTRLFRSGPAIRRKVRGQDYKNFYDNQVVQNNLGYYGAAGFKREASPFSVMGAYGILDRMSRYAEFASMEDTADIATALNVYADESCATDENGKTFHIYSDTPQVQRALEELFYDVLNIEFNARRMVRNLVKNGDYFMYVEVVPDYGVINVEPLPVNEVEREEGFDKHDPYAVRFRLITRGGKYLENWQMLHFRILGNDLFLPYGTSFLESARRPWRQLCHLSGTRVLTSTGYKNIEDIVAGETVYTHIPESKQTVKAKVKHVLDMGKQPIVSVETSHRTIKVTPNHGLLTLDKNGTFLYKKASDLVQSHGQGGSTSKNADKLVLPAVMSGNPSLQINFQDFANNYSVKLTKKASEIERKGIMRRLKQLDTATGYKNVHLFLNGSKKLSWSDYQLVQQEFGLTTPVEYYYRNSKKKSIFFGANNHSYELDKDFMKFFGFMLGDGWVKSNGFGFALGVYEQQNEEYIGYASKLFGNNYSLSKKEGTQSAQVNWSNTEVADVFRHIGFKTGFANKHIPNWVYDLDLSARRALVQGMFDADGCDNTKTICFANKKLMEQTQELCWTIGIPTGKTISVRPERQGHKESYKLWLDLTKPSEEVAYENVLRVVQEEQGQTWDLEVDHEEHNFLANGIVTHNTMMEDSMLVYRLVRSPERRVFYIDVSAVHPNDIPSYMEAVKEGMRGASVIEQQTGRQDFRYNPLPVHKDSPIPLLDGRTITIENLAKEYSEGKQNWVYSIQDKTHQIVPGKVVWCGKNYTAEKLIKVWLDDDSYVITAPEHPFVLRDGTSIRADELQPGQALMPLYKNHTVKSVEIITESADVYCMTVTGPSGEDDRHNFAIQSISREGQTAQVSGIIVKNSIDEDYFLPTRPNNQTKIESLAGGQNATAIEDVEFIHKKLIAALMVPKAYLTYDEAISSKATLAQEDIRFSRTVGQVQKILIAELNKLAMIHLYALGFSGEDLLNFEISFSNPSTVAVQQKLALISSKIEIAGKALELSKETGLLSFNYIQSEILGLRPEQINVIKQEARQDQVAMAELKKLAENPPFDKSIDSNIDIFDKSNYEVPTSPYAPDKKEVRKLEIQNQEEEQEYQAKRAREHEEKSGNNSGAPIKFSPTPNLDKSFRKSRRSKAFTGDRALAMPDFKKMLDITNNRYSKDPFDSASMKKFVFEEAQMENDLFRQKRLPFGINKEMQTSLRKLNEALNPQQTTVIEKNTNENSDELFLIEKDLKTE
jgi:intein/homing endonuclease